jgi:hypothetical protein
VAGEQRAPVEVHGVGLDHGDRAPVRRELPEDGGQAAIDLHGDDARARLGQGQGERAEPGPDLHDAVAGPDASRARDAAHGVGVDHEVLTQVAARRQPSLGQQIADGPTRQRHRGAARSGAGAGTDVTSVH